MTTDLALVLTAYAASFDLPNLGLGVRTAGSCFEEM